MTKKILIVDDDESILDAMSLILIDAGYNVEATIKGNDTFQKVIEYKPDIILLDVLMSGNDGREICRRLKDNEDTKRIPIIMISAHPTANIGAKEAGADDFLAKPFETNDLLKKVKAFT